jgi:hypothetical protein
MKYYDTNTGAIYNDEYEVSEGAREEIGKQFNGYVPDELVEEYINDNVEEWRE